MFKIITKRYGAPSENFTIESLDDERLNYVLLWALNEPYAEVVRVKTDNGVSVDLNRQDIFKAMREYVKNELTKKEANNG